MAVVIAGTFMSRFASSVLTPRVETEYAVSGTVSTEILQDVVIDGDKKTPVYVYPGLLAQEIYVSAGKKIEQGDPLMRVDVAAVRSEYLEKKLEQKKLKEQYWYTWGDEMAVMDDKIAVVDDRSHIWGNSWMTMVLSVRSLMGSYRSPELESEIRLLKRQLL